MIENAFGNGFAFVLYYIKKCMYWRISEHQIYKNIKNGGSDLVIDIHGDIDPYYNGVPFKGNAIACCHYPTTKSLIEKEDKEYLEKLSKD